jgi:DNA polymerase I-like protein with 3'-5' exonuclease and polymerase domains|tara:strand:+ start:1154 stop:3079 length:1926 start_codon:yes stop_codon:yes gene_type:complete
MIQKPLFSAQVEWSPPDDFPDLSKYDEISIDLETKDPDLKTKGSASMRGQGDVVGIAIAVKDWAGYYPIAHENGPNMNRKQVLGWFEDVLKTKADKIFHNAIYDMCWIYRLGLTVQGTIIDTMVMASLVDENRFRYDLNSVAYDYTGMGKNESALQEAAKDWGIDAKAEMYKLPAMYVGEYAERDAEVTLALWQELKKEIEHQDLQSIVELEQKVFPCILDMKIKGVRVSEDQVDQLDHQLEKDYNSYIERIKNDTDIFPEVWAAKSIENVCNKLGIDDFDRTEKTQKPSFTKNYLKNHSNPVLRAIASARQVDKLKNTFLKSIRNYVYNGRIHADIHQLRGAFGGTITGRLSYSNPNLQQLPNYTSIGKGIRSIFVPEEGLRWGCFDYSQQEPRLVVHYALATLGTTGVASISDKYHKAEEEGASKEDKKAADFHSMVADIANIPRSQAKTINLGLFYGMGKAKLQAQLGVSDSVAKDLLLTYHQKVPFVKQLIHHTMDRAQQRGWIRTILGRKCRFDKWEPATFGMHKPQTFEDASMEHGSRNIKRAFTYKALNKLIQGSAADMTKQAMVNLREAGITPMIQLHDELNVSYENDAEADKIIKIMEEAVPLKVPNKVDFEDGECWGDIVDNKEEQIDEDF